MKERSKKRKEGNRRERGGKGKRKGEGRGGERERGEGRRETSIDTKRSFNAINCLDSIWKEGGGKEREKG